MNKINRLTLKGKGIPAALAAIPQPPKQIYVLGELENLLERPMVAIVGSRKVTPYGRTITSKLAGELAEHGIVIVSGLALGVDSIAHQAALNARGQTIAIQPAGLDTFYPRSHDRLARQILETGGALISEYPEGMPPLKENFVARNRLVSGLSLAVLITEAAEKSGTLHTANFALEQGRTVFAVPGNITSELSAGTNNLIKAGAIPVTSTNDILNALNLDLASQSQHRMAASPEEAIIIELLNRGMSEAGELQLASELDAIKFNQTLTMLEISGKIRPLGAGHWSLL